MVDVLSTVKLPLQQLISKTVIDESSLPNSVLNRQQSERFIDLVIDYSVLLKKIRVQRVNHSHGEINKLNLGDIVTEGAHATSRATTRTPSESVTQYDTVKYRSAFDLKTDFTEDNLERGAVRDKLLGMFTKRMAVDTEMAAIESDSTLTTGDGQTDSNNLLGVNDGFSTILLANVPNAQIIDVAGTAPSKILYYDMKRAIPSRFRVAKPNYRWFVPSSTHDKWLLDVSDRETTAGDSALTSASYPGPWAIPMIEVPLMPEDLSFGTAGTDGSQIWLTPPENLIFFVQREITIEWERVPRNDMWQCTIHYRVDFEVDDPNMVVIATNVSASGADYTG